MTDFADLAALARVAIDAVHGEVALLKPTDRAKGPHGARTASAIRDETDITVAFYQDTELSARRRAQPTIGQTAERMLNRSPEIFGSTAYAGEIGIGDRLLRNPEAPTPGPLYEIVTRDPDGIGNTILGLAEIRGGG